MGEIEHQELVDLIRATPHCFGLEDGDRVRLFKVDPAKNPFGPNVRNADYKAYLAWETENALAYGQLISPFGLMMALAEIVGVTIEGE